MITTIMRLFNSVMLSPGVTSETQVFQTETNTNEFTTTLTDATGTRYKVTIECLGRIQNQRNDDDLVRFDNENLKNGVKTNGA